MPELDAPSIMKGTISLSNERRREEFCYNPCFPGSDTAGARLTTGYLRRGLSPDGGMSYFLPHLVGASRAAELILSARSIDAEEAERIGLVSRVLPAESFQEAVASYAADLASGPPIAQTVTKRLLVQSLGQDLRTQLEMELTGIKRYSNAEDLQEGIQAFLQKRKPVFKGR